MPDVKHSYVRTVIRGVELHRHLIGAQDTVIAGDFNSNAIWDKKRPDTPDHTRLVQMLDELGLVSSYHAFHQEAHGAETRPTLYFRWQREAPFHIDYFFVPKAWLPELREVAVGSYSDWASSSDHRPVLAVFSDSAARDAHGSPPISGL